MSLEAWRKLEEEVASRVVNPGVSPLEEMRKRSGLQFLQDIVSGVLPYPTIGKAMNFFPILAEEGRVVFQGTPKFEFYNPIGSIHGGWACTLLEPFGAVSNPAGVTATAKAPLSWSERPVIQRSLPHFGQPPAMV